MSQYIFAKALEVLQEREKFQNEISENKYGGAVIWAQLLLVFIFTFVYGLIMGSYNSFVQAISSGLKLWLLFIGTMVVCFPSFYIVQLILGSKIKIRQLVVILISGLLMTSVTMLAFSPIILFFQLSGDNYNFLQLLHVFVFAFSGVFGMRVVLQALTSIFEGNKIYPRIGLTVFKIWVIIFSFVGIQLSWNMRPFLGSKNMEFQLFRTETQGNFYSTVLTALGNLLDGEDHTEENLEQGSKDTIPFTNDDIDSAIAVPLESDTTETDSDEPI